VTAARLLELTVYLTPVMLGVFVAQFVRLRVQNLRAARPDPELGRKAVLHAFLSVAILLGLAGATASAADLMTRAFEPLKLAGNPPGTPPPVPGAWFNSTQRTAAALMLSGLMHGALFAVVLRLFTNDRDEPAVRRAHIGVRLVFAGMIWMTADTAALLVVFAEGTTNWDELAEITGFGLVWGLAAVVHLWLLLRDRRPADSD
jgi:hypothetical protein